MLRAVFARTLRVGVSHEQFRDAWVPGPDAGPYPARATISRDLADPRRVLTVVELDVAPAEFPTIAPTLFRPDALDRVAELIESTELEGVYEQVMDESSFGPDRPGE